VELFFVFFKASLITFAGQAALPVLHQELVQQRGWATATDISKALAIGRLAPGPTGMFVVSLGYLVAGWPGALMATLGSSLPPLVVLPLAPFVRRSLGRPWVGGFLRGIGLASAGLLAAVGLGIVYPDGFGVTPSILASMGLAVLGFGLSWSGKVHPVAIMGAAGLGGVALYWLGI
jgi:chromate transporter